MVLPTASAFEEMKQELSEMKNENESLDRKFTYLVKENNYLRYWCLVILYMAVQQRMI